MTMKSWSAGFRSRNLQYPTRAGHSAQENPGVGCACPQPSSRTLRISRFFVLLLLHRGQAGGSLRWSEGLSGKLRLGARLMVKGKQGFFKIFTIKCCEHRFLLSDSVVSRQETTFLPRIVPQKKLCSVRTRQEVPIFAVRLTPDLLLGSRSSP